MNTVTILGQNVSQDAVFHHELATYQTYHQMDASYAENWDWDETYGQAAEEAVDTLESTEPLVPFAEVLEALNRTVSQEDWFNEFVSRAEELLREIDDH